MNKIYIIEGQDRCGKTSLINVIRNKLTNPKVLTIHSSKPPKVANVEEWSREYYKNLINTCIQLHSEGFDIILDRAWLGEVVYGPIYRKTALTLQELEYSLIGHTDKFSLVVMTDSGENIAARSDGLSLSDDIDKLNNERALFESATLSSIIATKSIVNWSKVALYSSSKLNKIAEHLIDKRQKVEL